MHQSHLFLAGVLGLGGPELIVIFAVVMLLFGGKRLPKLATGLGKSIKEFKRASRESEESPTPAEPAAAERTAPAAESPPAGHSVVGAPGLPPSAAPHRHLPHST